MLQQSFPYVLYVFDLASEHSGKIPNGNKRSPKPGENLQIGYKSIFRTDQVGETVSE